MCDQHITSLVRVLPLCSSYFSVPAFDLVAGRVALTARQPMTTLRLASFREHFNAYLDEQQIILDQLQEEHIQRAEDGQDGREWLSYDSE